MHAPMARASPGVACLPCGAVPIARLGGSRLGGSVTTAGSASGVAGLGLGMPPLSRRGLGRGSGARRLATSMNTEIANLGSDALTFLATTVLVVPLFRSVKASPVLGFLLAGAVLNQLGLFRNVEDIEALSELGILFLLFEMGLELSIDRLKALAKYAFILGTFQVLATTAVFTLFELPVGDSLGTRILVEFFHSAPDLVDIRSFTEAVVIGAGLSLSSSAFVLQILAEKGELPTRFGSATLGILLLQDIAVVPLLVILPLLEGGADLAGDSSMLLDLGLTVLQSMLGLGVLLVGGRVVLRRVFEIVANARSPETFVALCLLTVTGTGLITAKLGFSDTLGAFVAGVLLAETNFRTQVEADIRPFRGLLLGLFFVTTGTSIDFPLLLSEWQDVFALLAGLIAVKTTIITIAGPSVGLTRAESIRTGFLLSQGGEFAFVVFALANELKILPEDLNRLLIIVVVLSMFITPLLADVGEIAAGWVDKWESKGEGAGDGEDAPFVVEAAASPVVICGLGRCGQVVANMMSSPLSSADGSVTPQIPYVVFDLDPNRVSAARKLGLPVIYGDGSSPGVIESAGIKQPRAVVVVYTGRERAINAVRAMATEWPGVPVYVRAQDLQHAMELEAAGASKVITQASEAGLAVGSSLLADFGTMEDEIDYVTSALRNSMNVRAHILEENSEGSGKPTISDDLFVYGGIMVSRSDLSEQHDLEVARREQVQAEREAAARAVVVDICDPDEDGSCVPTYELAEVQLELESSAAIQDGLQDQ